MLSERIVLKLNKVNLQTDRENMVICYGLELLLDFVFKIMLILFIGWCIGEFWESVIVFTVFGSIRSQTGGVHAKSGLGCTFYTVLILAVCLLFSHMTAVVAPVLATLYVVCIIIVSLKAPKTVNRNCFTPKKIFQKKILANSLLSIFFIIAFIDIRWRNLLICPAVLQVFTLIP